MVEVAPRYDPDAPPSPEALRYGRAFAFGEHAFQRITDLQQLMKPAHPNNSSAFVAPRLSLTMLANALGECAAIEALLQAALREHPGGSFGEPVER